MNEYIHCPYCHSENISYNKDFFDFDNGSYISINSCQCEECGKQFTMEMEYTCSNIRYYSDNEEIL